MSGQSYYRERLGFDHSEMSTLDGDQQGYEESLSKFKDERENIQKKTFTKWVNKHLAKTGKKAVDLFEDLRDGHLLVSLLEVLAGEHLPRERGRMRFHNLQNVQTVLDFLKYRKIKLVNIRAEDIVDGNPKLILGLIWTIILHFQISDIVVGMEENITARDALLKWAQKSTAKYPGVKVDNFTKSWRDGLAFNAIIHRNRPDLIDWRSIQRRSPKERLEAAFNLAERDFGVTRLLDAEDVVVAEPDERSLITYISSLYDAFPEPPRLHPLYDTDSQKKWEEYRDTASTLYAWIRDNNAKMHDRHFSSSLIEMRKMAAEMNRFRVEEIPPRTHAKQRLVHLARDVEKNFRDGEIDRELSLENIERNWQVLMMAHQEKDQAIHDEIKKLEKLQRIAEKIHREAKQVEIRLGEIEQRIEEEAKRINRLHPLDAKNNCDHLERDLQLTEDTIKSMFNDAQVLHDARFSQATELHRMVQHLHQRWISIRTLLHNRLLSVLASISFPIEEKTVTRMSKTVLETRLVETDSHFRFVQEISEWVRGKQKQIEDADYGSDLTSVQAELEKQSKEHRAIEKFQINVDKCAQAKSNFRGEELQLYITYLNNVQKSYSELHMSSRKRYSDLETLMDFVQSATNELIWLSEKEEREITRDWSSKNLNLVEVEQYYEVLMSELEKREIQFNAVQDRGESLVLQHHPASKCIETYMSAMQTQWAWVLQLTLCLETHLKYVATYQQYFSDVRECEQTIARKEEILNSVFSKSDFSLDEGEVLLKDMQDIRDELTKYGDFVEGLTNQSREIIPLKQRKTNITRTINVTAICSYKQNNQQMVINKDERCILQDNSQKIRWKVTNSSGLEGLVPGVCFLIPPPDKESLDAVERLRKQYDRVVTLWQKKQLKMRQNMIFATIKVVKSWDLSQFLAMGAEQRNAIRKALNEDAEKLFQEGDQNDPALRRLRREIDDVNKLFDEFERKASDAEKSKSTTKLFSEQITILHSDLEDTERTLSNRVNATLPRDLDVLDRMVVEHKEFEYKYQSYQSRVQTVQRTYTSIPQKTPALQAKMENLVEKWERVGTLSSLYVERLKCIEVILSNLEETTTMVSQFEHKLSSYDNIPTDDDNLKRASNELFSMQNTAQVNQSRVDQLMEDTRIVRQVVEKSRGSQKRHPDVEKLEDEVHRTTTRWNNAVSQVVDRLRFVEETSELSTRDNIYQTEMNWLESADRNNQRSLPLVETKNKNQPHMTLYNSVIEEKITIEQVNTMGARLAKEARLATEEKYRVCSTTMDDLLDWLTDIEKRLAMQETVKESLEEVQKQLFVVKKIREDIQGHSQPMATCLDQMRQLVATGGDVLSSEKLTTLEKTGKQLKTRFDRASDQSEKLLRKLTIASDELKKYKTEATSFKSWMEKSIRILEEKERNVGNLGTSGRDNTKAFVSDVIAHQGDLRFITMSAQKFLDESREYLQTLNEFRTNLPQRLPFLETRDSFVRQEVTEITHTYQDLLARANKLFDRLSNLGSRQKEFQDALDKAIAWLKEISPRVQKTLSEPIAGEPKLVEEQLNRAKALQSEILSQGRIIDSVRQATNNLLNSMEELSPSERSEIEGAAKGLELRYQELIDAMNGKVKDLDSALAQSQEVQDAVDGVSNWIGLAENQLRIIMKPASLIRERLDEQIREVKILQADIDSHRPSIENMARAADDLLRSGGGRVSKKAEGKLKDVLSRYEKLVQKLVDRAVNLNEVSTQLDSFSYSVSHFEQWFIEMFEIIDTKLVGENAPALLEEVLRRKDEKRRDFDEMIGAGKALVSRKDVTDTTPAKDKIKSLENQWKDLNAVLEEKNKLSRSRTEHLNAYEKLRDQVNNWLNTMEIKVSNLRSVAVNIDVLRQQTDELKSISKEHRDYSITIDKVNELGCAYDAILRSDSTKRRPASSTSPIRRTSSSFRASEPRSPSPSKLASGGFGSRRTSQEVGYVNLEDTSPVQIQLNELNNRYSLLGMKLSDRQNEIDTMREEIKKITENLKTLAQFLDKEERLLPKDTIPQNREEADKLLKAIQRILEDLYDKQGLLDNTKSQVTDLVRKKPDAPGVDDLQSSLQEIIQRWKGLQDTCKQRITFLENVKEFHDSHYNLNNWLTSKDKMMGVLGPISSEPGMVQNQLDQVRVIRDEFRAQKPILDSFNNSGDNLLVQISPNSPDGRKIEDKLASINQKWNDLLHKLDEREGNLDAASGASSDFYNNLNKLQDNLHKISDDLDDLSLDKGKLDPDELLKRLNAIDKSLENQRPVLSDVEASGLQLCEILNDPISKADIQKKLAHVARLFNQCQKKLDNCKAELENSKKDVAEFEAACEAAQDWLDDVLSHFTDKLIVSANRDILRQQIDEFEPLYKEIMNKEHEIVMTINKGKELTSGRSTRKNDQRGIQQNIDRIQKTWDKLKKETLDRHTRLQSCMEHCRKYDKHLESFLPWLTQVEDKLSEIQLSSLNKTELDKLLKDLNSIKSDIWRHAGEYESCRGQGETFLTACDKDKEGIKEELRDLKERWDALNAEILAKAKELEDAAARLNEFNENLRDVKSALNRCEDRLASADDSKDPKVLQKIKAIVEETQKLEKPVVVVKTKGDGLCKTATQQGCDSGHIKDTVEDLLDKYDSLRQKLDSRSADLEASQRALAQFAEKMKAIGVELGNLGDELNAMKPIGRDIPTVKSQLKEIDNFLHNLQNKNGDIESAALLAEELKRKGYVVDTKEMKDQIDNLRKQLSRLDSRGKQRENDLDKALAKLEAFYDLYNGVNDEINDLIQQERSFSKSVGGDVDSIRAQQAQFKEFKTRHVDSIGKEIDECNKTGQGLIQSAANGVNTSGLEKDLETLNDKWNALKDRINEQERKLDFALLQSGKFQEALEGLNKWLHDIEEMVSNQKPPSADFKVVKAQLQEQKFLNKMLLDRQPSVISLFKMGKEVAASADPSERAHIEEQMADLGERYENLCDGAKIRQKALEDAMIVAKEFQDKLGPISDWLDKMRKKLKDMSLIPSDEDKIQKRIKEHDALHDNILKKQPDFNDLADIAASLMELVGDEEATIVADKLQELTDHYSKLVEDSEALGKLLKQSKGALRHLVLSYEELIKWMDDMDKRLNKHKVISVHKEKLMEQMDRLADLTEEIRDHEKQVLETVDSGLELMKNISNDEAIRLKDKLDSLQRRFGDVTNKATNLLKSAHEALPLVTQFHDNHKSLSDWLEDAEGILQALDNVNLTEQEKEISRLGREIQEERKVLEIVNQVGAQLCQLSPGEGASTIEGLVTRDNRRFEAICEQVQRRAERIQMSKQRSMEVLGDIDDLLDWFRDIEGQIKNAEKPSCEPQVVRIQLQEHRALNDEIASQKGRVRDVLAMAKKVLREASHGENTATLREKADDLKETMEAVCNLSSDRLNALEQALPLAEHFVETHIVLSNWMDIMEDEMAVFDTPAIRPDQIMKLQDKTQAFLQSINEHKPLLDKLNKTGAALMKLCNDDDAGKVDEIIQGDNERYNALRAHLREQQQALEKALQETSLFKDKLDGMLNALESTADQVNNAEPISAHPEKIREQIDENSAIIDDVKKREDAFNSVTKNANDVINKAVNKNDPAIKEIKQKLDRLNSLWDQIQKATKNRGKNLDEALVLAEKFWAELHAIMEKLDALQDTLKNQEPVAVEPKAIQKQQNELLEIKKDIERTKPEVVRCRQSGQSLMKICGDQDKPEIKKNIEDLDGAWDNITALFAKREENLIDAMEKAMEFHETLQALLRFLEKAEKRLSNFDIIGADIEAVKKQIKELKDFKSDVDPMMVKVESLNRQAYELTERTAPDQAAKIRGPLAEVNRRWDDLLKGIVARHRELEDALLRLGQFQHALNELMAWIEKTNKSLENLKPVFGDPQVIEVELAKLKVLVNDIQAHQNSVDTLNDAGRKIIESEKDSDKASNTQQKLNDLNKKWEELQRKALARQNELEDALKEAQAFNAEIQDLLFWLNDIDGALSTTKPVGGLPETASEQLARFMEIFNELEMNKPKVEAVLQQGQEYLKKSAEGAATNLQNNLRTLKQRWDSVMNRANDKKIKLEIAMKEANEFHRAVQGFIDWLSEAERYLTGLEPVSRVLDKVVEQVETHKDFQKEVSSHREVMLNLEKKGNHLKYFSQKQDVILIKNLLISVQHRWDRVVSKSTERTRALDLGFKEAKEFHDSWSSLCKWLDDAEKSLDEIIATAANNPVKIKQMLAKHKEFQRLLGAKQPSYDSTMRIGKALKDKAPKPDEPILRHMLTELKNKWNSVCNKSVERQRNLEEALLRSGQFKDALQELLDWLKHIDGLLVNDGPVHGDLDTVLALIEQHKKIEEQLDNRRSQMTGLVRTGEEMMETASVEERAKLASQVKEVKASFEKVKGKCDHKSKRLEEALKEAEKLHKAVHMLLEWFSDAERRLRQAGSLPEDEAGTKKLIEEQDKFMRELLTKEHEKDDTLALAKSILAKAHPDAVNVIKHWISIIQSRWDEISSWAKQRQLKLQTHLASLRDMEELLEELMAWLQKCEDQLTRLEAEALPDDFAEIQILVREHKEFMEDMAKRQPEIDSVCKPKLPAWQPATKGKMQGPAGRLRSITPGVDSREGSPDLDFAQRRLSSPGRERTPDMFPHIGPRFDRRGSKAFDPQIKNPQVKALWDKWKHVWMMAWERQRRLLDKHNYLMELEKVKNFSWDDWRKRFLKFMNHKKSRVTDLFRKIDRNNNGLIPREEFIDAIMKTKFPTSRLEMNAVADMFDHGDQLVDYMEFIAALRPDWEEKKVPVERDVIDDEIQRQVMKCTCRQKFRVLQVGEGKYRFGDSQKLRLVRILRSTVMVRVGGGWVALDEFLVKNDPCRAKGRTNIELREQFILADGVSQTMTAFKPKPSSTISSGNRSVQSLPTAGPITKVKERSIRSVPMGRARSTERTTPDSTFSDDSFSKSSRLPRKSSGLPTRGSQPGSRSGSKPPSRAGSNVSLDSTDDQGSRIPIRRSASLKRGSPASSRTPLASSTPSRVPFSLNTNVNGSSITRGRSPSGAAGDRTRTPSGSSVSFNLQSSGSLPPTVTAGSHSSFSTATSASASATQGGTTKTSNLSRKSSGSSEFYAKRTQSRTAD